MYHRATPTFCIRIYQTMELAPRSNVLQFCQSRVMNQFLNTTNTGFLTQQDNIIGTKILVIQRFHWSNICRIIISNQIELYHTHNSIMWSGGMYLYNIKTFDSQNTSEYFSCHTVPSHQVTHSYVSWYVKYCTKTFFSQNNLWPLTCDPKTQTKYYSP